ncbi:hypothetical protein SGRA_0037 [Saprospira grandis str. Lewin]|uniref:Uncharacterized protein n=1 Tax=Saprospira grandis (strain Lewin) TaxID=984262 RepID=H6L4A3_SAPGL|nr:hypothetical protein SGRA_0037 [Saprospira grandis str. Lewin]
MDSSGPQGQTELLSKAKKRWAEQACELRHSPTRPKGGAAPKGEQFDDQREYPARPDHNFMRVLTLISILSQSDTTLAVGFNPPKRQPQKRKKTEDWIVVY